MDARVISRGETVAHNQLKRLAVLWAQAHGYSACAMEVNLPKSRYRADVAAYRPSKGFAVEAAVLGGESGAAAETAAPTVGTTAIFECKQALVDLRRDNCDSVQTRQRLETVCRRRQVLERNLRIHFPSLRIADSLFPEFDSHDFAAIRHRGYARVLRELNALQNRLYDCTKFETLIRYRCANLFFLVLPRGLYRDSEIPVGWGALVESNDALELIRKPVRYENSAEIRLHFLHRIAAAGTRVLNRQLQITFDDVLVARCRSC